MSEETPRPDIVVPAAYSTPIAELKRRWARRQDVELANLKLQKADLGLCDECQKEIEAAVHDEGVAVDAIASALNIRFKSAHRNCFGPRKLPAEDIAAGSCGGCGAKIVVEGELK